MIVATLKDGRVISKESLTATPITTAECAAFVVHFPDLKQVEHVMQINPDATDCTAITPFGTDIKGNVVGLTIYGGAATTISGHAIAIGF